MNKCSVKLCREDVYAKGICRRHYQQKRIYGKITYVTREGEKDARRKRMIGNKFSPEPVMFKSKEHIEKMRKLNTGNKYSEGKKWSEERKQSFSDKHSGENSVHWRGGINDINNTVRKSRRYKLWREKVFKRDNYTCRKCDQYGGSLNAHHIKSFSLFEKLRFIVSNGVTLCGHCHKSFHKIFGKLATREDLINFLKRAL